ncbi:MAG TPA: hypothetical protein VFQ43_19790 [Nitrososphaera sp.]|nr:hypothetical protein [Nitrososphaera sp.]
MKRRKRQSELVEEKRVLRTQGPETGQLKKRFWKDVHVREVQGMLQCCVGTIATPRYRHVGDKLEC